MLTLITVTWTPYMEGCYFISHLFSFRFVFFFFTFSVAFAVDAYLKVSLFLLGPTADAKTKDNHFLHLFLERLRLRLLVLLWSPAFIFVFSPSFDRNRRRWKKNLSENGTIDGNWSPSKSQFQSLFKLISGNEYNQFINNSSFYFIYISLFAVCVETMDNKK